MSEHFSAEVYRHKLAKTGQSGQKGDPGNHPFRGHPETTNWPVYTHIRHQLVQGLFGTPEYGPQTDAHVWTPILDPSRRPQEAGGIPKGRVHNISILYRFIQNNQFRSELILGVKTVYLGLRGYLPMGP